MAGDSSEGDGTEVDDVSSMHSDFLQFNRRGRAFSGISSESKESGSSSEMEAISDNDEEVNDVMRKSINRPAVSVSVQET